MENLNNDFIIYRKDRQTRGGGVLIAVKCFLHSSLIFSPSDLEVISVKLSICNHEIILCSIYIPPDSSESYLLSLLSYLTDLVSTYYSCIFVGDFNFPDIDWLSLSSSSPLSNNFCEFIFDCNLTQHVLQPTHVKGDILDLVLTTSNVILNHLSVQSSPDICFSDHFIIRFIPQCTCGVSSLKKI